MTVIFEKIFFYGHMSKVEYIFQARIFLPSPKTKIIKIYSKIACSFHHLLVVFQFLIVEFSCDTVFTLSKMATMGKEVSVKVIVCLSSAHIRISKTQK